VNDALPLFFSGLCTDIERIHCSRCTDFTPYSKAIHNAFGIGLPNAETFNEKLGQGAFPMHRGLTQSMDLIADNVGWEIDQKKQEALPIITQTLRKTPYVEIYPETVVGCRQILSGLENGKKRIILENVAIVKPNSEVDGFEPLEVIKLFGNPYINITITGELEHKGAIATAARAVNLIPRVINSKPGYLSSLDLPAAVSLRIK
jgi:4-hydroxy-tetrahydrodipicolinate reductase